MIRLATLSVLMTFIALASLCNQESLSKMAATIEGELQKKNVSTEKFALYADYLLLNRQYEKLDSIIENVQCGDCLLLKQIKSVSSKLGQGRLSDAQEIIQAIEYKLIENEQLKYSYELCLFEHNILSNLSGISNVEANSHLNINPYVLDDFNYVRLALVGILYHKSRANYYGGMRFINDLIDSADSLDRAFVKNILQALAARYNYDFWKMIKAEALLRDINFDLLPSYFKIRVLQTKALVANSTGSTKKFTDYLDTALVLCYDINVTSELANTYRILADSYTYGLLQEQNSALIYADSALKYYELLQDKEGYMLAYRVKARISIVQKNYDRALVYYNQILRLSYDLKDTFQLRDTYAGLTIVYRYMKRLEEALAITDSATKYLLLTKDIIGRVNKDQKVFSVDLDTDREKSRVLKTSLAIQKLKTANARKNALIIGLSSILAVTILVIALQSIRRKKKEEVKLFNQRIIDLKAELLDKARLFNEIKKDFEESQNILNKTDFIQEVRDKGDLTRFINQFKEYYPDFQDKVNKYFLNLTNHDERLIALIKLNFTNQELADITNVTYNGIVRAKIRIKNKLKDDLGETKLSDFIRKKI
ncbi:MAG: hypothetical protein MRY83_18320 [Flavobacteriales bacterium]|nr:hypothetical protein [Flavobacteriales bacterium]